MVDVVWTVVWPVCFEALFLVTALILIPLALTVILETVVAALFGLGRQGVLAVALVSGVTNPPMNLILSVLYGLGVGFRQTSIDFDGPSYVRTPLWFAVLVVLEIIVVLVEWRLLVSAISVRFDPRRLLAVVVCANVTSALAGLVLVVRWSS